MASQRRIVALLQFATATGLLALAVAVHLAVIPTGGLRPDTLTAALAIAAGLDYTIGIVLLLKS